MKITSFYYILKSNFCSFIPFIRGRIPWWKNSIFMTFYSYFCFFLHFLISYDIFRAIENWIIHTDFERLIPHRKPGENPAQGRCCNNGAVFQEAWVSCFSHWKKFWDGEKWAVMFKSEYICLKNCTELVQKEWQFLPFLISQLFGLKRYTLLSLRI